MVAPKPKPEPAVDKELEEWGQCIQQERMPERLQLLAAQLREALLHRQFMRQTKLDS